MNAEATDRNFWRHCNPQQGYKEGVNKACTWPCEPVCHDGALRMQRWGKRKRRRFKQQIGITCTKEGTLFTKSTPPTRTHSVVISHVNMLGKYLHPFESKNNSQGTVNDSYLNVGATCVEAGSNTSTVTLRVVRGDEMGLKKAAP
jgi:hypothetical protein